MSLRGEAHGPHGARLMLSSIALKTSLPVIVCGFHSRNQTTSSDRECPAQGESLWDALGVFPGRPWQSTSLTSGTRVRKRRYQSWRKNRAASAGKHALL